MTARWRATEKMSVKFTLMPSARSAGAARIPSGVAGILMKRFGRSTSHHSARA
jgi:hypothetical protein